MSSILVTGAAGFIGHALSERLLALGHSVIGIDAMTPYYDVSLKEARLDSLRKRKGFRFERLDLSDRDQTLRVFGDARPPVVVHLAAQPGVRYSLENPHAYIDANIVGFVNVLEGSRQIGVQHLVYASSSSVYGGRTTVPFRVQDRVDHPVSLYAATKKTNELLAHVYSHVYALPTTGLRFFTVYGPWGRPDMAPMLFTKAILEGRPISVFNHGQMQRDFTYIDDVIEGVIRVMDHPPLRNPSWDGVDASSSRAPYKVYNIGNSDPVELMTFIETLEKVIGRPAAKIMKPMQPGDVPLTYADVGDLERDVGFRPHTPIADGLLRMVEWYREFYRM